MKNTITRIAIAKKIITNLKQQQKAFNNNSQ